MLLLFGFREAEIGESDNSGEGDDVNCVFCMEKGS